MPPPVDSGVLSILYRSESSDWSWAHGVQVQGSFRHALLRDSLSRDTISFFTAGELNLAGSSHRDMLLYSQSQLTRRGVPNNYGGWGQDQRDIHFSGFIFGGLSVRPIASARRVFDLSVRLGLGFDVSAVHAEYHVRPSEGDDFVHSLRHLVDTSPSAAFVLRLATRVLVTPWPDTLPTLRLGGEILWDYNSVRSRGDTSFRGNLDFAIPLSSSFQLSSALQVTQRLTGDDPKPVSLNLLLGFQTVL